MLVRGLFWLLEPSGEVDWARLPVLGSQMTNLSLGERERLGMPSVSLLCVFICPTAGHLTCERGEKMADDERCVGIVCHVTVDKRFPTASWDFSVATGTSSPGLEGVSNYIRDSHEWASV